MNYRETDMAPLQPDGRDFRQCQTNPMPMAVLAIDYPDRATEPPHSHPRAQLIHIISGVVTVWTEQGSWVVPPNRGLWIPAGVTHSLAISGLVRTRTLYVEQSAAPHLPDNCTVVAISPLLRELILAAVAIPLDYAPGSRDAKVMELIVEECRTLPVQPLHLPRPADDRISRICDGLMRDPADRRGLKEWAASCRITERTAARAFLDSTGMTFGRWRQQLRLIESLPRLARGQSVLTVALDLGYDSPSAFTAMFRRALGVTPSEYFE